jgi:glycosyltransferase 2 family protein
LSIQSVTATPARRNRKVQSWILIIVTNLLSLLCLIWVLNGADLPDLWGEIQHMKWQWVLIAAVSDVCVYLLHGTRWKLLLAPVQRIPFMQCVQAIYVGLFANEVLPLRAGELIRCVLLSKTSGLPVSVSFASALIERIFDGIWLLVCFYFTLHMGKLPGVLLKGGYILGVIIVVLSMLLAYAMYAKQQSINNFFGFAWPRWFNTLIEDLHLIGHSRYLYFSFLISGLYMICQMLPIYSVVRAANLDVPWTASFTMLVLLRLSSIVPQAPGNLGSFQWARFRVGKAVLVDFVGHCHVAAHFNWLFGTRAGGHQPVTPAP